MRQPAAVEALLMAGAEVNADDRNSVTPLRFAEQSKNEAHPEELGMNETEGAAQAVVNLLKSYGGR